MLSNILILITGLGVFLFATKMLSEKLETIGGNRMRKKIYQFSNNRFKAVGFGFVLTTVFQSTTASVVMITSFTSLGMLTLFQSVSLIIGANVASSIPGFLISFQSFGITDFFCAIAGIGAIIFIFSKKPWLKNLAQALVAFGLLFVGLLLMKQSMNFLLTEPSIISFFSKISNPILLLLLGAAFTMLVQSSLGTIAVVVSLIGTSSVVGVLPVSSAVYMVYGASLGTAITTAIISSLSSNLNGKRAAVFHILFSIVGCLIFGLLGLTPWIDVCLGWIKEPAFKLMTAYSILNVTVGIILLPFVKYITILLCKTIKSLKKKRKNPLDVSEFNDDSAAVSIAKATKKVFVFYSEVRGIYKNATDFISEENGENFKKYIKRQQDFNMYLNKLNTCVAAITFENAQYGKDVEKLLMLVKQIERISHNCGKIIQIINGEKKLCFSAKLNKQLQKSIINTNEMFELCQTFVQDVDCKFLAEDSFKYEKILTLSKANSDAKLAARTYVIENAAKTRAGNEKNTTYIEITSYLNMISNNISDIVFALVSDNPNIKPPEFEQLSLEDLNN